MTLLGNLPHQGPRKPRDLQVFAPIFFQAFVGHPQFVGGNRCGKVVRNVDVDVVTQKLDPTGIFTMNCPRQLGVGFAPVVRLIKRDLGSGVVYQREGAHPEMVDQPGHEPEFDETPNADGCKQQREDDRRKGHD